MKPRIVGDVSSLPDAAFSHRSLIWWGVLGFILIEGTVFVLAGGAYFFLMNHSTPWPPHRVPPELLLGTCFTVLMMLSEIPNVWADRAAHGEHLRQTRIGLALMTLIGLALMVIRYFEFQTLNVSWDDNAYGSIVWALLFLHTVHLVTDWVDTLVLTVFAHMHDLERTHFSDVADNCLYWHFVAIAWLPIYALLYWVPRMMK
ncbi:cytochrome c oxidase subunit 3 [Steroidobacter sp. S1-65]|uniref:cytochrome-c oxidase n=1 Tax=Steroidobacter gossypii TaxID=2805490 RepID=A0ABS1X4B2_9GAMM|nr:cytochrome c oxidase subunit 3 [Steroidobacter gossypii]MBM0108055.1 cytochrome c oxidase subunit 3 [Steroidobacter gossypii]